MAYFILVRHGETEYNEKGLWTGWLNPPLTELGRKEAREAGEHIKDIQLDGAYVSDLIRAKETLQIILETIKRVDLPQIVNAALNERNYGDFSGKNKWDLQKQWGNDEFQKVRRGWDHPIPNGESLKQVYQREIPYVTETILPRLKTGENIIVVSSGNALRCIVKFIENISDEKITLLEIHTGEVYTYEVDSNLKIINKEIRSATLPSHVE